EMDLKSVGKLGRVKRKQFLQKRDISRSHEKYTTSFALYKYSIIRLIFRFV
ncbi:unnamed protein product, partial [Rotaria sp. Silwood1]